MTDAEPPALDEAIEEVEALTAPDEAAAEEPEPTPTRSETTGDDAEPPTRASDPSPAPAAGDNASELPTPADATAVSSPPPGPKNPKKRGLRLWPGEKGAETLTSTVSTTTLLDPSHGEDEHDDNGIDPGAEDDDDDGDSVEDAVLDPEPDGAEDPAAELRRLAEENAELRRQLAASKGGDA